MASVCNTYAAPLLGIARSKDRQLVPKASYLESDISQPSAAFDHFNTAKGEQVGEVWQKSSIACTQSTGDYRGSQIDLSIRCSTTTDNRRC
jgi:hypothetical protein